MTTTDPTAPALLLAAHIEERILAPLRRNPRAARWFVATVVAILALHGALLGLFLMRDQDAPKRAANEPTPIEVVVEQPKEEPKPHTPKRPEPPKPAPKQAIEKPASSAPRAPSDTKVDTASVQKETHAPKAPTPPTDGQPNPEKEASSPSTDPAEPNTTQEAAEPDVLQKDAEALDKTKDQPKEKPKKVAKLTPKAKTRRARTALQQLAGASTLPDYSFARPTKKSPVYGGTEDSRYLAIVYGMIMQHRAVVEAPGEGGSVTIVFHVDDDGNVFGIGVQHTSGYPQIDAEAAMAIRRASPFPPPPAGAPHSLVATIDFGDTQPVYTMGSQGR